MEAMVQSQKGQPEWVEQDEKALPAAGHKGGDVPLVELVNYLKVHVQNNQNE